jgi:hypothetical protein
VIHRALLLLATIAFAVGAVVCQPATAASDAGCIPEISEATGHYNGNSDQSSHSGGKEAAHHHAPCSGHYAASSRLESVGFARSLLLGFGSPLSDDWRPLAHGFEQLRPPIA